VTWYFSIIQSKNIVSSRQVIARRFIESAVICLNRFPLGGFILKRTGAGGQGGEKAGSPAQKTAAKPHPEGFSLSPKTVGDLGLTCRMSNARRIFPPPFQSIFLCTGVGFERNLAKQHRPQQNNPELQLQLVPSTNTFTCFPNLPPKLRQAISKKEIGSGARSVE
jgi:hypothetical protein